MQHHGPAFGWSELLSLDMRTENEMLALSTCLRAQEFQVSFSNSRMAKLAVGPVVLALPLMGIHRQELENPPELVQHQDHAFG